VSLENLKMTKNELIETKIIVEELSAKLNGISLSLNSFPYLKKNLFYSSISQIE
jgi:hypothetical protein